MFQPKRLEFDKRENFKDHSRAESNGDLLMRGESSRDKSGGSKPASLGPISAHCLCTQRQCQRQRHLGSEPGLKCQARLCCISALCYHFFRLGSLNFHLGYSHFPGISTSPPTTPVLELQGAPQNKADPTELLFPFSANCTHPQA